MDEAQSAGGTRVDPRSVGGRLCDGRLAKGGLPDNPGAYAQGQIQWQTRKGRCDGECAKKDTMAVRGTANGEERQRQQMGEESNVGLDW